MRTKLLTVVALLFFLQACMQDSVEYRARHILVNSRAQAEQIILQLHQGADFASLAKQYSIGPSGPKGGDLGWFAASRMVKPFAQEVRTLKVGAFSATPVQTQFGWHVVLVEEMR